MKIIRNVKLTKKMMLLVCVPLMFSIFYIYTGYSRVLKFQDLSSNLVDDFYMTTILLTDADKDMYQILSGSYERVDCKDELKLEEILTLIEKNSNDVDERTSIVFDKLVNYEDELSIYVGEDTGLSQVELVESFNGNYGKWLLQVNQSHSSIEVRNSKETFTLARNSINDLSKIMIEFYDSESYALNAEMNRVQRIMLLNAVIAFIIVFVVCFILIYDIKSRADILLTRLKKAMTLDLSQDGWYSLGKDEIGVIDKQVQSTIKSFQKETIIRANVESIALIGSWEYSVRKRTYKYSPNASKILGIGNDTLFISYDEELEMRKSFDVEIDREDAATIEYFKVIKDIESNIAIEEKFYSMDMVFKKEGEKSKYITKKFLPRYVDGQLTDLIGVFRDTTEEKEAETLIIESTRLNEEASASRKFIANMSHEIRTPLNAILGYTEIMKDQNKDKKLDHYLKSIDVAGNSLLSLVTDILDYSKIKANKFEASYTPALISDFCEELKVLFYHKILQKNLSFEIIYDTELPTFMLPISTMRQVLINLVGNASKFTQEGGIVLRAEARANTDGKYDIDFSVTDTGIGIAKESLELIFKEFEQADLSHEKTGTGLGLALSVNFANLIKGSISVDSEVGKGSTFTLHVKDVSLASDEIQALNNIDKHQQLKFCKQKVLILDDVADNREVLKAHCKFINLESRTYETGGAALASIERYKPDLILTDLRMPTMNGEEFAKNVRALEGSKDTPIICITASINPEENYHLDNFNEVLNKPIGSRKLSAAISKYLKFDLLSNDKSEMEEFNLQTAFRNLEIEEDAFNIFQESYYETLLNFKVVLNPKKIKNFSKSLMDTGNENNNDVLIKIGQHLLEYCEAMDISNMMETITLMIKFIENYDKK